MRKAGHARWLAGRLEQRARHIQGTLHERAKITSPAREKAGLGRTGIGLHVTGADNPCCSRGERGENPYFALLRQIGLGLGDRRRRVRDWQRFGEQGFDGVLIGQPSVPHNGRVFIVPNGKVHRQGTGGRVVAGGIYQGTWRWDHDESRGAAQPNDELGVNRGSRGGVVFANCVGARLRDVELRASASG
jgi:hypothetical protein